MPKETREEYLQRRKKYVNDFQTEYQQQFNFKLSKITDADLIEVYKSIPNKIDFIRDALRRYAEEHNIKTEDQ